MAAPNTGGQLKSKITDMKVGDYIKARYNNMAAGYAGAVDSVGTSTRPEAGFLGAATNDYTFYFIKVDKGLLVADRVLQHSISWDELNKSDYIQGKNVNVIDGIMSGIIRSLGGGNSYASATGTSSTTDTGNGAWPIDNEWDRYIVKKDYGTGAGRDDVWHWNAIYTFTQDTLMVGVGVNTARMLRGKTSNKYLASTASSSLDANRGFRPVFQYQEGGDN